MIEFNLNNKDYNIKEFLSINDYQKIFKVKDLFEDEYLNAKVINLLTDCPMDQLLEAEAHKIQFLATSIFAMVPKQPITLTDRFELDGVHYGYLPSYKKLSFAEFIDLDTLLSRKPEEVIENLHIITAMMYRPIIKERSKHDFDIQKYDSSTIEERAELFKNKLDIKYTLGGQFFFIQFVKLSSSFIRLSFKQKMKLELILLKMLWRYKGILWKALLKKDSGGMSSSIELQRAILHNTTQYYKKTLLKS
jgi:hypothetical protein